jgi:pimeloyl-ACP methyl ester carboxylesterase
VGPLPAGLYSLEHEPYDEDAPLVALVHGTMDRSAAFGRVVQGLSDLHVIAYDRRGYARSARAQPLASSLADHADDLLAILDGRPATVVGHSYGGDVAMLAATRRPDVVTALGVFESPLPWMDWWPSEGAGNAAFSAALDGDPGEAAAAFFRRLAGPDAWDELPERTRADRRAEGPALLADIASIRDIAPPFDIAALPVPLIVGCGTESLAYQRDGASRLASIAGADLVEIDGGAHGSHTTHPGQFAAFVRRAVALGRS